VRADVSQKDPPSIVSNVRRTAGGHRLPRRRRSGKRAQGSGENSSRNRPALVQHELGHTVQADSLGGWYIPVYLLYAVGTSHESDGMERNANWRAGLPLDWNGGSTPQKWTAPWFLTVSR
jgi:hypothetical protein